MHVLSRQLHVILVGCPHLVQRVFVHLIRTERIPHSGKTLESVVFDAISAVSFQHQPLAEFQVGASADPKPDAFDGVETQKSAHGTDIEFALWEIPVDQNPHPAHEAFEKLVALQAVDHFVHTRFMPAKGVVAVRLPERFVLMDRGGVALHLPAHVQQVVGHRLIDAVFCVGT